MAMATRREGRAVRNFADGVGQMVQRLPSVNLHHQGES